MPPALVVTRPTRTALGLTARLGDRLLDRPVIVHTLQRLARIAAVDRLVLVHPAGDDPRPLVEPFADSIGKPIAYHADAEHLRNGTTDKWAIGRAFALACWRGGLGQATCYDELLPAGPLVDAAEKYNAESVLLVGADWPLVDPALGAAVLDNHLTAPEQLKLCFTQAPPGLSPIALHRDVLRQLADHPGSGIGPILGYNPHSPAMDPISKDVNTAIDHRVRDTYRRLIHDTPRAAELIDRLARRLGESLLDADAMAVAQAIAELDHADDVSLPQQVTLELTPRRPAAGRVAPQHHVDLDRGPIEVDLARRVIDQLAPDTALRLGGLGDALLHPDWQAIADYAAERVLCVALDTDLLATHDHPLTDNPPTPLPDAALAALVNGSIDLITVRLNADSAAVYRDLMGVDGFSAVMDHLKRLHNLRAETANPQLPWIVPRLAKTTANLTDMETFFERWLRLFGTAVIEPASCGCGLMPDLGPVPMHPPARTPCRQLGGRLSVLSDGAIALCDQDWLGRDALGNAADAPLVELVAGFADRQAAHDQGRVAELTLCGQCTEWHRP
ncbi:MAG: hypothetical protein AAFY08_12370 [Planctomycetota bacterium]